MNAHALLRAIEQLRQQAETQLALCDQLQAEVNTPHAAAPNKPEPERAMLLDREQVAALLGVSVSTVWRYRRTSQIPEPITVGSLERWRRTDIETFISSQAPHPA